MDRRRIHFPLCRIARIIKEGMVYKMEKERYCNRCGHMVFPETDSGLKKEYPYYCKYCDENLYEMETFTKDWKFVISKYDTSEIIIDSADTFVSEKDALSHANSFVKENAVKGFLIRIYKKTYSTYGWELYSRYGA